MENLFTINKKQNDKQLLIDIFQAYRDARKNKRNKKSQIEFEFNYESKLIKLYKDIIKFQYKPLQSIAFINTKPVIREVFAAHFQDRIVHHLIYNHISPIFEKEFITDSYSCRKNKGTLYGINRVYSFIDECSKHYTEDTYILTLDIKGYFYSIDKDILYDMIKSTLIKQQSFLKIDFDIIDYLIKTVIFTDSTKNVKIIKDDKNWSILPKDKSLFYSNKNCGLPIGNLTSQLFSNIYMNMFDQYVKNTLNIKFYGRYVDDFILIHNDKQYLIILIDKIRLFLKEKLKLILHPNKIYLQHFSKGVKFLGGYIKPHVKYIDKRTKGNFNHLIRKINQEFEYAKKDKKYLEHIRASINSYLGIMGHFSSYKLKMKSLSRLNNHFFDYFYVDDSFTKVSIKKYV
jgi:hypothetical protein